MSDRFFNNPPQTITRDEANRVRRECKDHLVVVHGKVALHMCRDANGVIYVVDEAIDHRTERQ